jgi:hypothetical protein
MHIRTLLCIFIYFFAQVAASDTLLRTELPPLLPDNYSVENAVVLFESSYHCTRRNNTIPIIVGPCSPCIGGEIINRKTGNRWYLHYHHENDLSEIITKLKSDFGVSGSEKQEINLTLFTCIEPQDYNVYKFKEGNHENRMLALANIIATNYTVHTAQLYYNHCNTHPWNDDRSDRWLIFINGEIYRFDPWKTKIITSRYDFAEYVGVRQREFYIPLMKHIETSKTLPLACIKNPNLREINNLHSYLYKQRLKQELISLLTNQKFTYPCIVAALVGFSYLIMTLYRRTTDIVPTFLQDS